MGLQNDLKNVSEFCRKNNLRLNPNKCQYMRISLKTNDVFEYKLEDKTLDQCVFYKQIGIFYDHKLTFDKHIDYILQNANKKFYFLRTICKKANAYKFLKVYQTYIIPILEYSNLCLVLNQGQSDRLESFQRKITKFICFKLGKNNLSYEERLKILKLQTLEKTQKYSNS